MSTLAEAMCARVLEGTTGALAWTDGKRRRLAYFDHGAVVLVQSNLRSESPERLGEMHSGLGADDLAKAVGRVRLAGALKETAGECEWTPAITAPRLEPVDFAEALWMTGLARPPLGAYARVSPQGAGWVLRQPLAPELARYLCELDGTRTLDEVYSFAPGGPDAAERWLRIGFAIGAFHDTGIESSAYEVRSISRKRPSPSGGGNIASLIAEGLGDHPPTPAPPPVMDPVGMRLGPMAARIQGAPDHFAALGVSWQDSGDTLRRAYFNLARELHPDRFVEDELDVQLQASRLFDRVRAAWEVLADDGKREAYIAKVVRGERTAEELTMEKVRNTLDAEQDFKRGLSEYYAGRLAQAHELFVRCAARVPDDPEFAAFAGYTTFKLCQGKDPARAEEGAERLHAAVRGAERLDSGWVLVGLLHRAKNNDAAARDAFVTALKLKPANPDALRELKRMDREKERATAEDSGFFARLFKAQTKERGPAKKR